MWSLILSLINVFVLFDVTFGEQDESVETKIGFENDKFVQRARDKQFPYVGYFSVENELGFKEVFCGGSIIHKNLVLTAGHCCEEVPDKMITFITGTVEVVAEKGQERRVIGFYHHESISNDFVLLANGSKSYKNEYDIGVAKLIASLDFNEFVKPILLNRNVRKNLIGRKATYMGWGITNNNSAVSYQPIMLYSQAKVISLEECRKRMTGAMIVNSELHMCTLDDVNNTSTCEGDSGGPLVIGNRQVAVTTDVFCSERRPSVFHNVAVFFDWIRNKLLVCGDELYEIYGNSKPPNYRANITKFNREECHRKADCKKAKDQVNI